MTTGTVLRMVTEFSAENQARMSSLPAILSRFASGVSLNCGPQFPIIQSFFERCNSMHEGSEVT